MTHFDEDDAFAMEFDDAVSEMHQTYPETLGVGVWRQVEAAMSPTAGSKPHHHDESKATSTRTWQHERNTDMDATLAMPISARSERRAFAWMAAGLALLLAISGLYLNTIRGGGDGEQHLAWAPATAEATPTESYACDVEPLTVDEVMDMVLNPNRGYARLGQNTWPANLDELSEPRISFPIEISTSGYIEFGNDPDLVREAVDAANLFSTCVSTGTAFQVWSLYDPALVQIDIISRFPVLRTESELRAFVEETGPHSFAEYGGGYVPRFDGQAMHEGNGNWIIDAPGLHADLAIIPMATVPFDPDDATLNLSLKKFPNEQWIVTGYQYKIPGPRG